MVYGMAWQCNVSHGIWYDLAGMAWYMTWPGVHGMVWYTVWHCGHGMVWWTWNAIWYGLAGIPLYMIFTRGVADVSWRSCSHVPYPFTSRGPLTCMFRSHVQLLFTLDRDCVGS